MDLSFMDLTTLSLTSITGITAATFVIMEILKRTFSTNVHFGKIPAWCYCVAISMTLCLIASKLLHATDGGPLLPGSLEQNLWKAILAAAQASGFYSWIGMTSIANAVPLSAPSKTPDPVVVVIPKAASMIKKPLPESLMRIVNHVKLFLLCLFLFAAATLTDGCASADLTVQTTQARTAYTGVLQSVNVAYKEGFITSAQLRVLDPYRLAIDTALNAMQAYATSDPAQWQAAFTSFQAALADFEKNVPATQSGK